MSIDDDGDEFVVAAAADDDDDDDESDDDDDDDDFDHASDDREFSSFFRSNPLHRLPASRAFSIFGASVSSEEVAF